jgi:alpha-D-ribose 1-methylphosphonate 5-triphosphate synthase subunit PhnH
VLPVWIAFQVGTKHLPNKLIVLIVQLEELQPGSVVKLNAIYVHQAAIKKTMAVLPVWIAFRVGTKTSPNKLIVLIVQLEELQQRLPVKLNAIHASQAAIKKTAAWQSVWFVLRVPMHKAVAPTFVHCVQMVGCK